MVDWEREGGWWTGHTGSGMKETQWGRGTRTSRPTGCIGNLLKEDHFMTKNQMRGGGGRIGGGLKLYTKATNRHQPREEGRKSSHFFLPRLYGKNYTECDGGY
jgi:hypothetical protein